MPNKLTDAEVKKALEICIDGYCRGCCYGDTDQRHCRDDLMQEALDLINRYERRIENLKAEIQELNTEINMFRGYDEEIKAETYKEFAERLKEVSHPYADTQMVFELQIDKLLNEFEIKTYKGD